MAARMSQPIDLHPDLISLPATVTEFLAEHLATQSGPLLQLEVTMRLCSGQEDRRGNLPG